MSALAAAAFGERPDLLVTGEPGEPRERWLAAVVLGGQGWYARAAALLDDLVTHPDPETAALACATLASHRRQLGGHAAARVLDAAGHARLVGRDYPAGHARSASRDDATDDATGGLAGGLVEDATGGLAGDLAEDPAGGLADDPFGGLAGGLADDPFGGLAGGLADDSSGGLAENPAGGMADDLAEARSDVLLGLAADAVGAGRLGEARRLVARAPDAGWRGAVRRGWVSAEIDLSAGRADAAVAHARQAAELAAGSGSVRHRIKSGLVLGAALAADGDRAAAEEIVRPALDDARDLGLLSLVWPGALIMADLVPADRDRFCRWARLALRSVLRRADPVGRRLAERSPWVPRLAGPTG